jgi:hypothetical protein
MPIFATPVVLELVVEVFILVVPRNPANGLVVLRNASSFLLDDEPIDETTTGETYTSNVAISIAPAGSRLGSLL